MNQPFGEILKERRTRLGLSQRALSERLEEFGLKLDPTAITRMETGQREPRLSEALNLAEYLNIDLHYVDYGSKSLSHWGKVDTTKALYVEARRALIAYINSALGAVTAFHPLPDQSFKDHQDFATWLLQMLHKLPGQETKEEGVPALRIGENIEFCRQLLDAVEVDLLVQRPSDAPRTEDDSPA